MRYSTQITIYLVCIFLHVSYGENYIHFEKVRWHAVVNEQFREILVDYRSDDIAASHSYLLSIYMVYEPLALL